MAKEYFVLREEEHRQDDEPVVTVVYEWGHYDQDGAEATMRQDAEQHPRAIYRVVRVVSQYCKVAPC